MVKRMYDTAGSGGESLEHDSPGGLPDWVPVVMGMFREGRLSEDQVRPIANHAPDGYDESVAELAGVDGRDCLGCARRDERPSWGGSVSGVVAHAVRGSGSVRVHGAGAAVAVLWVARKQAA